MPKQKRPPLTNATDSKKSEDLAEAIVSSSKTEQVDSPPPVKAESTSEAATKKNIPSPAAAKSKKPPSRMNTKAITGHFDPSVSKQLKMLAVTQDSSIQELLREAINDLFTKHGKNPIA